MRKLLLLLLFIFTVLCSHAQQTAIVLNSGLGNWNAMVHLPSDYTASKTYPTIIFFPGDGEVGTNASLVIANGPGAYITQGWNGNVGNVEFIVISLQPNAAYPQESTILTCIKLLEGLYSIDKKNLFLTGLSMGGWCSSTFVTADPLGGPYTYASQIKAIVTVEGVKPDDNSPYPTLFQNFAKAGGKDLCFEQSNDGRDGQTVVNTMNATIAGSAQFITTTFGNTGHCCWSNFYGGGGTAPGIFTINGTSQTLYQWFASLVVPTVVVPVPVITSATTLVGISGTPLTYTITASNTPTSYSVTGLPSGLSLNSTTGIISGIPTTSGTFAATIGAINSGGTGTSVLNITITTPVTLTKTIITTVTTKTYSDGTQTTTSNTTVQ